MENSATYNVKDHIGILEFLQDGVLIVDNKGVILFANASAAGLFSKDQNQLPGSNFGYMLKAGRTELIQIVRPDRILHVQALVGPVQWDGENASLISLRDVTELKRTEFDLRTERQKLVQSNAELAQYASRASHDLNEPIRKILVFSKLFTDKYGAQLSAAQSGMIEKITRSAHRLKMVVEGVTRLNRVKTEKLAYSPVDLSVVISQIIDDIEVLVTERKVNILVSEMPVIKGDANFMYQLFFNLITNAIKYSKKDVNPIIWIYAEKNDREHKIMVEDNGIGFENEMSDKVFEPFERLSTEQSGSGIGLAICKQIVEAHYGSISVKSTVGKGSVFSIVIPNI